ncbi:pilus assembly protein TadG-related protein [Benzoatithermus flavus]
MVARRWPSRLRCFWQDRRGNAAMVFALVLLPLTAAAGIAVDSMLAYTVENELQKSLDAAGLAAGRTIDPADVEADARSFFASNFGAGPDLAALSNLRVDIAQADGQITLTATARMPTTFMRLFGRDSVTVSARTVVNRQTRGMELVLVLDTTYSMMSSNKITGLKTAATELLDILYGDRETVPNLWVGVVPYIAAVNVGTANIGFLAASDRARAAPPTAFSPDTWGGCVLARAAPRDQNDDPPSIAAFRSYLYPDTPSGPSSSFINDWGSPRVPPTLRQIRYSGGVPYMTGYGPNAGCPPAITPLVAEKSRIIAAIQGLLPEARGGTLTSEGVAWGWRVISPRWRGLWAGSPFNLPLAYGTPNMDKVMVVLTDGDNQMLVSSYNGNLVSPYTAYESHVTLNSYTTSATQAELDRRTRNVCSNVKAQGIVLYTITFGSAPSATGQVLMRDCATDAAHYFHSPDNATLRTVFKSIGSQLSNLRLAR